MKTAKLTQRLVECSLMIALATVLSILKLAEMPYGGSITFASMLPMIIVSYRCGLLWGLGAGTVFAAIQQLLGLNNLSYVTGWQAVLAVIIIDYMLAFAAVCLGGVFRGRIKGDKTPGYSQSRELALGTLLVCVIRYIFHTVAGATVWAGLSIPSEAALLYSIGYNATYMIPETIVTILVAMYIGEIIDFRKPMPRRFGIISREGSVGRMVAVISPYASALVAVGALIADAALIFPHLQNAESGEFTFAYLSEVNWTAVIVITAISAAISIGLLVYWKLAKDKTASN